MGVKLQGRSLGVTSGLGGVWGVFPCTACCASGGRIVEGEPDGSPWTIGWPKCPAIYHPPAVWSVIRRRHESGWPFRAVPTLFGHPCEQRSARGSFQSSALSRLRVHSPPTVHPGARACPVHIPLTIANPAQSIPPTRSRPLPSTRSSCSHAIHNHCRAPPLGRAPRAPENAPGFPLIPDAL
jgi:hypothetical protein